jgi:hypothetical protein
LFISDSDSDSENHMADDKLFDASLNIGGKEEDRRGVSDRF